MNFKPLFLLPLLLLPACQTETRYVDQNSNKLSRRQPAGAMYNHNGTPMKYDFGMSGMKNSTSSHGFSAVPGSGFSPSGLPKGYIPQNP